MKFFNDYKTYIGMVAAGILGMVVATNDGITWETQWVQMVASGIVTWTGVAVRHAISKVR